MKEERALEADALADALRRAPKVEPDAAPLEAKVEPDAAPLGADFILPLSYKRFG